MIFSQSSAFGLDLSDYSIKLAWLKKTREQINLISFGREEIPENIIKEGEIKNEQELIEIIKRSVERAKGEKIKTPFCVVSLPESESFIRMVQLPRMKPEEVAEAIKWELEANIPVSLKDVYFDWQIIEEAHSQTDHLDVLIGALAKTLVDPYLSVIKKAGLRPLVFEVESIATARALIKKDCWSEPLMIIDLGAKRTSIIIFAGGTVWFTTSLPISNNLLVDDITQKLKITRVKAKSLKFKIGLDSSKEKGKVFSALEPRLFELVAEVKKYLDYYQTNLLPKQTQDIPIGEILLCGGGANLSGLTGFLSSQLKIKVSLGNPWVNILDPASRHLPDLSFSESLAYTTALGLALRGLNDKL